VKRPRMALYKVFSLQRNGARRLLDPHEAIIIELQPGIEVEVNLAPHPNFAGDLVMYTPPTRQMKRLYEAGKVDSFAVVFGAENVLHVKVERRIRRRQSAGKRSAKGA
jgi:hypothetical protein